MNAEPGFFEAFYAGPLQHPWLLWLAVALGLVLALAQTRLPASVRRYCVLLAALAATDAWLTADHVFGVGALSGPAASLLPLTFVLLGDFRYLLLVTSGRADGRIEVDRRGLAIAAALTLVVPLVTQGVMTLVPESAGSARVMFAVYEVGFLAVAFVLLRVHPNVRANPWVRSVTQFVMLYYALWAAADMVILSTGSDLGYMLRVIPNLLYYGGLIAAIALFAPNVRDDAVAGT